MYEAHFNLDTRPFNLRPDPAYLFLSRQHTMALSMLEYGLFEQDAFTVITGEVGCGKSMLVRYLLNKLDDTFQIGLISNTHSSFGDLLHWVTGAFGIARDNRTEAELYDAFVNFLVAGYRRGLKTLLIVDEAQNLDVDSLEEIRVLSNINADGNHVMQLLLVGQPELRDLLQRSELVQVAQRIATHFHLEPLSGDQVSAYIIHRLKIAGATRPIFSEKALEVIADASGGIPRLINQLCDACLVYSFANGTRQVPGDTATQVVNDRIESQVLPLGDSYTREPGSHQSLTPSDSKLGAA